MKTLNKLLTRFRHFPRAFGLLVSVFTLSLIFSGSDSIITSEFDSFVFLVSDSTTAVPDSTTTVPDWIKSVSDSFTLDPWASCGNKPNSK